MGIQKNSQAVKPLNAFVLGNGKNQKNYQTSKLLLNLMRLTVATNVKPCMPKRGNVLKFIKLARDYSHSNITDKALWDTYQVS